MSNIKYQKININFDFFVAFLEVEFLRDFEYSKIEHIIERIVAFYTFQKNFSKKIIFKASKVDFLRCFPLEMCNFCHKYDGRIFVGYYSRIWVRYEYVFDYKMSDTNSSKIVGVGLKM